ncbi:MAG: transcription termination/antitermination protein NusG [Candidatus Binatia bacterium]|nr:MAG: transcription termination/antitermination protein NusG [Candidatus Binatia bacterium]
MAKQWYAVQTYSGQEHKAKAALEERIRSLGKIADFGDILVPQERVVELVKGRKKTSARKFFPGYILVEMEMNDENWQLVRATPKIIGFVGGDESGRNPPPLRPEEVQEIAAQMREGAARPRPKVQFQVGDTVKVKDGPFQDFTGTVEEVKLDKGKLRVLVNMFGRSTPVELDFGQVEKA